ncbi:VOC family protein [Actinokineospora sp. HUAS TT18]|uniref:VOC family protein n=1 Tax=Actinokineospora sp. HUAS TT18 TaxID=3447451 RepID=UPI003F51D3C0
MTGVRQVALTVSDVDRSVPWYERVLGFTSSAEDDAPGLRRVLLDGFGITLTLVQHLGAARASFDGSRPGLDRLTFAVDELRTWAARLTEFGVPFTAEPDEIAMRDPDGIQLALRPTP